MKNGKKIEQKESSKSSSSDENQSDWGFNSESDMFDNLEMNE